jgi:hypothetical protein
VGLQLERRLFGLDCVWVYGVRRRIEVFGYGIPLSLLSYGPTCLHTLGLYTS